MTAEMFWTGTPTSAARVAVDADRELRLGGVVVEADGIVGRIVLHGTQELGRRDGDLVVVRPGDRELEALPAAADAEAVGGKAVTEMPGISWSWRLRSAVISCCERVRSSHGASVTNMKPPPPKPCAVAKTLVTSPRSRNELDDRLGALHLLGGVVDRRPLRGADRDRDEAAVLERGELVGEERIGDRRGAGEEKRGGDDDDRRREAGIEQPRIEPLERRRRSRRRRGRSGCGSVACSPLPIQREASIGTRVSATKADSMTAKASTKPNSEKSRPAVPGKNEIGMNTAASVTVVDSTAKNTCRVPSTAAARGPRPSARCREMFSMTTIASSTTSPVASTRASSVRMLIEKPAA